jgi:hypothetical protein
MNNLLNRLKKVERAITKGKSIIRFIEKIDKEFIITQSSKRSEIGLKLNDLNSIESLNDLESITFIEDIKE